MADISIQQGEGFFDLVVQVSPTPEGTGSSITYTRPDPDREAAG